MKEERTHFDNQIRQALAGHSTTPSPALRDALMARLATNPPRKVAWYQHRSTRWLMAALFFISASVLLYILTTSNPNLPEPAPAPQEVLSSAPQQAETPTPANVESGTSNPGTVNSENSSDVAPSSISPSSDPVATPFQTTKPIVGQNIAITELPLEKTNSTLTQSPGTEIISLPAQTARNGFHFGLTPKRQSGIPVTSESRSLPTFVKVSKAVRSRLSQDDIPTSTHYSPYQGPITVGLSYTPEIMFNVLDDDNKFVHNASLDILFHYHDFSIRTGAGLGFAKGSSAIAVEYNPYKGSYQHLDSLDFVYDMHTEQLVAVYHMSERSVYDSVSRDAITKINKEYTYLQIPLIFGYKFFEKERFGMSVSAGPTLSMLLNTKESSDFDPGKNLIINTTTLSPDRIKTNWQFSAGLGFNYHLTPKLAIEIEPRVKYYFNSVYEKAATIRKPWSLELRSGVLYTF